MRFEWSLKLRWQRLKACTANCRINNQPNELPNFPPIRCNTTPRTPPPSHSWRFRYQTKIKRILIYRIEWIWQCIIPGRKSIYKSYSDYGQMLVTNDFIFDLSVH